MKTKLPKYFKPLFWFSDFDKLSLQEDKDLILFQVLEKGRMEHIKYIVKKFGKKTIYNFATKNKKKFSRKSIYNFAKIMFS